MAKNTNSNKSRGKGRKPKFQESKKDSRNNNYNNKKRDTNTSDRENIRGAREDSSRGFSNDPNWWMKAGQLSKDTSTISTYNAMGAPAPSIDWGYGERYTPAGIARYDYVPFFGDVNSPVHPLNVAAKIMYDLINSKNSRNTSYDPSDLMIYVIAVAQAWSLHSWVRRIIGMYNTYSTQNRYWWTPLMESMGIKPISVSNDIVTWRNLANRMALKLNMLSVPNGISYFDRAIWMPSAVYADAPTEKASLWYFQPLYFLKYSYDSEQKGQLTELKAPWNGNGFGEVTPVKVEEYFDSLTENLFNDSDINVMGSDIVKAYGNENCFKLPQISEDYLSSFIYDPIVNLQLHNATINPFDGWDYKLTQDMNMNCLKSTLTSTIPANTPGSGRYFINWTHQRSYPLDFPVDTVTNEMMIEATRLLTYPDGDIGGWHGVTEMLINDSYWVFEEVEGMWILWEYDKLNWMGVSSTLTKDQLKDFVKQLGVSSKFHDSPIQWVSYTDNPSTYNTPDSTSCISDFTNFTTITHKELDAMNEACTLSIFSPIPLSK